VSRPRVRFRHPELHRQHHERTLGEHAADSLASVVGSWRFILIQAGLIFGVWIPFNAGLAVYQLVHLQHFDPYPFILLNLGLSLQAAFTGPVLQLSSNRQSLKDRALWEHTALEADRNDRMMLVALEALRHLLQKTEGNTQRLEEQIRQLTAKESTST
jgi:uncharacterized membrane protein